PTRRSSDLAGPLVAIVIGPVTTALVLVAAFALAVILSGTSATGLVTGLRLALSFCLVGGVAALAYGFARPWVSYTVARTWLALRGRLPWRLMSFLDDAHRLGLLRQVGPYYQFRHADLQDRLARPRPGQRETPTSHPGPPPARGLARPPAPGSPRRTSRAAAR